MLTRSIHIDFEARTVRQPVTLTLDTDKEHRHTLISAIYSVGFKTRVFIVGRGEGGIGLHTRSHGVPARGRASASVRISIIYVVSLV